MLEEIGTIQKIALIAAILGSKADKIPVLFYQCRQHSERIRIGIQRNWIGRTGRLLLTRSAGPGACAGIKACHMARTALAGFWSGRVSATGSPRAIPVQGLYY